MTVFGHLWSTQETDELFGDEGRTRIWLAVLGALAAEQGELGLIPGGAAAAIAERAERAVDLEAVGEETRRSGHSTLGLIRVLQRDLDEGARQWVSFGATVQDVADTWTGLVAQRMLAIASRDLSAVETSLVELAVRHRDAVMLGRTHGQPGLPITFGFKASVWIAEIRRHRAASNRHDRGSRSASWRARSGRSPPGARPARSSSAACSRGSASACPTSRGSRPATGSPSWSASWMFVALTASFIVRTPIAWSFPEAGSRFPGPCVSVFHRLFAQRVGQEVEAEHEGHQRDRRRQRRVDKRTQQPAGVLDGGAPVRAFRR